MQSHHHCPGNPWFEPIWGLAEYDGASLTGIWLGFVQSCQPAGCEQMCHSPSLRMGRAPPGHMSTGEQDHGNARTRGPLRQKRCLPRELRGGCEPQSSPSCLRTCRFTVFTREGEALKVLKAYPGHHCPRRSHRKASGETGVTKCPRKNCALFPFPPPEVCVRNTFCKNEGLPS